MSAKCLWLAVPLGFALIVWADSAARPDLNGNWRLDPSLSEIHSHVPSELTWQIEQDDNSIHLIERSAEQKDADDVRCGTDGKDCKVKEGGHKASVSFYYNGPVLVELETEGSNAVTKKRMQLSSDGSKLTVEVIHVLPAGEGTEKLVLSKQAGPAQTAATQASATH